MAVPDTQHELFSRLVSDFLRELEREEQSREAFALEYGRPSLANLGPSSLDQMVVDRDDPVFKAILAELKDIHVGEPEDSIFLVAWLRFDRLRHEGAAQPPQ